jgi:hypothetical protein
MTQAQDFADLSQAYSAGNVALSNRNLFVDGAKEIWNATSNALANAYTYTANVMYAASAGLSGVAQYNQLPFSPGGYSRLGVTGGLRYYGGWAQTTASTGTLAAFTGPQLSSPPIEDPEQTEGRSVTLSVWLCCTVGAATIQQVTIGQNFGVGGSPSASVTTIVPVNWVLTPNWQRYSVRCDVPSCSGKVYGTTYRGHTRFTLWYPIGSTYTINDMGWQAEVCSPLASGDINGKGGFPTTFEYRGQAAEQARVERYYETLNDNIGAGSTNSTTAAYIMSRYRTLKRIVPSVTLSGTFTLFSANVGNVSIAAPGSISPIPSAMGCQYNIVTTGLVSGQGANLQGGANSLITIDARP